MVQPELASCLSSARNLRTVHVNRPMGPQSDSENIPVVPIEEILRIVLESRLPKLRQIGFNTRVMQVKIAINIHRVVEIDVKSRSSGFREGMIWVKSSLMCSLDRMKVLKYQSNSWSFVPRPAIKPSFHNQTTRVFALWKPMR
jgi:hypothetical protein